MRVLHDDVTSIDAQLQEFARQMPQAVQGMPVILEADSPMDLGAVLSSLKRAGMQPLGVAEGPLSESARSWGLAVRGANQKEDRRRRGHAPHAIAPRFRGVAG